MKYTLLLILFITTYTGYTQPLNDSLISNVENGLTRSTVVPAGDHIPVKNIYNELKAQKVNGVSVAVINNYEIEWAKSYGVADYSKQNPLTNETLFQCASIGKMITAISALRLVKENKIGLDENVNDKLTDWKVEENKFTVKEKVTLRRLLSHSAGLSDDYGFKGYEPSEKIPTLLQVLKNESPSNSKKKIQVEAIPGTIERYSGGGYLVVQKLIEDISGQSFSDYVDQHIFGKLGMTQTTYDYFPDVNLHQPVARGHYDNGKIDNKKQYHVYPEKAAAGPWTTATDLAKLVIAIQKEYQGKADLIIGQELCREMLTPQINYKGLSVHLKGAARPEAFWHAGNNAGYVGLLYGMIHTGQGAVILTNSDAGETLALEIISGIANAYSWPVMRTYTSQALSKQEMESYAGVYQSETGSKATVGINEKGLFLFPTSPKKELPIHKINADHFTVKDAADFLVITFEKKEQSITGMTLMQNLGKINNLTKIE